MPLTRFYMIYVQNGASPTRQHLTMQEARLEAERLTHMNHGRKVYILQALSAASIMPAVPVWENVTDPLLTSPTRSDLRGRED